MDFQNATLWPARGPVATQAAPLAHRAELQSWSSGFAAPRWGPVPGFSGRTQWCRWALGRAPQPRGRGEARALPPTARRTPRAKLSTRKAPRIRSVLTPARSAADPASPSQTPAPPTHPVRSALPPRGPGSRPGTRSPAPRAPPPRPPAHARCGRAGARQAPTGLTLRPGGGREARGARAGRARARPGRLRAACGRGRCPAAHSPPPWPSVRAGGGGQAGPRMRCSALIG